MKKSIIQLLLFLIVPLLCFALLEIAARQIYLPHSDMFPKSRSFLKVKDSVEVIFTGHSHAEKGIDPSYISMPAFNLSYSAQDMYYNQKLISKISSEIPKAEILIIALDYFVFGYDQSKSTMYYVKDYFSVWNILPANGFSYSFFLNSSVFWLHRIKFFKDFFHNKGHKKEFAFADSYQAPDLAQDTQILLSSGYRYSSGSMDEAELISDAKTKAIRNIAMYDTTLESKNFELLTKMCRDFLSNVGGNRQIMLIYLPLHEKYHKAVPQEIKERSFELINKLTVTNDRIDFYDFTGLYNGKDHLYLNADHLNNKGAASFSQYLDSLLIRRQETSLYN